MHGGGGSEGGLPVWLVAPNGGHSAGLEKELMLSEVVRLQRKFCDWHPALEAVREAADPPEHVVLVQGSFPDSCEFKWMPALARSSRGVVVLLEDLDDRLVRALHCGVRGFLLDSSPLPRIFSAISAVADGGVVMSPEVLERISSNGRNSELGQLTGREAAIVSLLAEGHSARAISEKLSISYLTARTHIKNIHRKLGISTAAGVVSFAFRNRMK